MLQSIPSFLLEMTKQFWGAIAKMNGVLAGLGLEQHPDKTTIGPAAHGFGFLGHTYSAAGLGLAWLGLAWLGLAWLGRENDPQSSGQTASAL